MDLDYCLTCESQIAHVHGQAYCSSECLMQALGDAAKTDALRPTSPFSFTTNRRTTSRGSGHLSSGTDSRSGGRSSNTNYDYSTSDAGYESTNPTTTEGGNEESGSGLEDSDFKHPQFFPRRRLSVTAAPSYRRTSPLVPTTPLKAVSESHSLPVYGRVGHTAGSPSSLLPPPRPRPIHSVSAGPWIDPTSHTLPDGAAAIIPVTRGPYGRRSRKDSKTSLHTASSLGSKRRSRALSPRATAKQVTGFFFGDGHEDEDGSDADSECDRDAENGPVNRIGLSGLRRISSGQRVSGQKTPTSGGSMRSKHAWSFAELYRDSPVAQSPESADEEEENTQPMSVPFEQQSAESSDDDNGRRGRQRGLVRRISLTTDS